MSSMMACRHALQIAEIVRMICDEAESGQYKRRFEALLALATTSKTFSEPALNIIWREQDSLVPLVKCMPDTLWQERQTETGVVVYLRRPIAASDLPRLLFYSVRVRSLDMEYTKKKALHPEFLRALDLSLPQSFMPKLSHFAWTPKKDEVLSIMRHFMNPEIRKITLELGKHSASLSILPYITSACPFLSDLTLNVGTQPRFIPFISEAVCGWHHLTDLSIPNLDQAGFTHVAQLPSLKCLSLCFVKDMTLYPPDFLSGSTFPVLKSLFVRCETARFCIGVIKVISSRQCEDLTIRPLATWTTTAWQELHTSVRDHLANPAFNMIDVEYWEASPPEDITPYVLSAPALRPLLAIKSLSTLSYQIYPNLDVNDDFLEEMARAWRKLQSLNFGTEVAVFSTDRPQATLKCLVYFARHCRRLSSLGLHMDATTVPEFKQLPGQRIRNSLEALDVGVSPIDFAKEAQTAAFISNLFPRLEYLFTCRSGQLGQTPRAFERLENSWNRVEDMIPVFNSVRSEEEEFWAQELAASETESVESSEDGSSDDAEETS
ncbi:hypothetical protein MSAN_01379200 [Mycena sanguinolenta]|uniref:F-box domain-containing protein n=1 Tax=Mycena sanguinolenta TaxID=230812 RepID=A0A8H7D0H3_9AGAR|nr:hypothetical protein MSAN_01379200 [Mycena sanguinolenta]